MAYMLSVWFWPFRETECVFRLNLHQNSEIALSIRCIHFCISFLICLYYGYLQTGFRLVRSKLLESRDYFYSHFFFSVVSSTMTCSFCSLKYSELWHSFLHLLVYSFIFFFHLSSLPLSLPSSFTLFLPYFLASTHIYETLITCQEYIKIFDNTVLKGIGPDNIVLPLTALSSLSGPYNTSKS